MLHSIALCTKHALPLHTITAVATARVERNPAFGISASLSTPQYQMSNVKDCPLMLLPIHNVGNKGVAKEGKNVAFYVNFFILFRTSLAALIPEMITIGIPPPGKVQWPA